MLADEERKHTRAAGEYEEKHLTEKAKSDESESHKRCTFSKSSARAPRANRWFDLNTGTMFAAAFATQNSWKAFLVGLAASIGAGISMGFAESQSTTDRSRARFSLDSGCSYGFMTMAGGSDTRCRF